MLHSLIQALLIHLSNYQLSSNKASILVYQNRVFQYICLPRLSKIEVFLLHGFTLGKSQPVYSKLIIGLRISGGCMAWRQHYRMLYIL
jgi:hypothetical protein